MTSGLVIGVVSGCGGAGSSVLAAAIAGCASRRSDVRGGTPTSFLIDCDPLGGGIDVLLGCELMPGPRWSKVRLRGGELDPSVLLESLPRWGDVAFLSCGAPVELDPVAIVRLAESAAAVGNVVLHLPRWPSAVREAAIGRCDRVVLVTPAEVRAVTASAFLAAGLDPAIARVAVRGVNRGLTAERVGQLLGLPVLGSVPFDPAAQRSGGLHLGQLRKGTLRLAEAALRGARPHAAAA